MHNANKQTHSMRALINKTMQKKYHFSLILNLTRCSFTRGCGLKIRDFLKQPWFFLVLAKFQARKCNLM